MAVAADEQERIRVARQAFLSSPEGRRAFTATMGCLGLFRTQKQWEKLAEKPEQFTALMMQALTTLADLGILIPDNFGPLVDAMAQLPMPTCD